MRGLPNKGQALFVARTAAVMADETTETLLYHGRYAYLGQSINAA
jgi:hypothetical protein